MKILVAIFSFLTVNLANAEEIVRFDQGVHVKDFVGMSVRQMARKGIYFEYTYLVSTESGIVARAFCDSSVVANRYLTVFVSNTPGSYDVKNVSEYSQDMGSEEKCLQILAELAKVSLNKPFEINKSNLKSNPHIR